MNYVKVDHHHYSDTTLVYDENGEVYKEFSDKEFDGSRARKRAAEYYADCRARELGCAWGAN